MHAEWLLAGLVAGLADYSMGIGFGLAASIVLAAVLGHEPRSVAAAASTAQLVAAVPAYLSHRRAGNITRVSAAMRAVALIGFTAATAAAIAALLASRLPEAVVRKLYVLALASLPLAVYAARPCSGRAAALALAAAAGAEKAIVGGGFAPLMVHAARLLGLGPREALAAAPVARLPATVAATLLYALAGYMLPAESALLSLGALASAPLAAALLRRVPEKLAGRVTMVAPFAAAIASLLLHGP